MIRLAACLFFFSVMTLRAQPAADTLSDEGAEAPFRQSDIGVVIALGLSTGGGFGDLVNEELKDQGYVTTGRMLFVDAELGMEFRAADRFFLVPRIGWIFTALNRRDEFEVPLGQYNPATDAYEILQDDVTLFSMLTCSAGARYYFHESDPFLFYAEADVGFLAAVSRVSPITFSADAPSAELLAGYSYNWSGHAIGLELGWRSIPVTHPRASQIRTNGRTVTVMRKDTRDFGGVVLNVVWRLDFFN